MSSAAAAGLIGPSNSVAQHAAGDDHYPAGETFRYLHCAAICRRTNCLRAEGFTDIRYVMSRRGGSIAGDRPRRDRLFFALLAALFLAIEAGENISSLPGPYGLFRIVRERTHPQYRDLKGKNVGVPDLGTSSHVFVSSMAAHVGLDPAKDINWVRSPSISPDGAFR